jgi:hypothetical protein
MVAYKTRLLWSQSSAPFPSSYAKAKNALTSKGTVCNKSNDMTLRCSDGRACDLTMDDLMWITEGMQHGPAGHRLHWDVSACAWILQSAANH